MKKYFLSVLIIITWSAINASGQGRFEGKVYDSADRDQTGLPGANVYWAGTTTGTSTNAAGYFSLRKVRQTNQLVISFIGYRTDTVTVPEQESYFLHGLKQEAELFEVVVTGKAPGAHISKLDPILTINITGAELRRAACCNLSESFETNASVDVNYTDAVTGAKQIQLLGLAGIYTQIMTENIPTLGGIASSFGLNYIPGPWMESIQVSKGTSSVRNGYESIAGQVNVEFKKPAESESLYLNGFISDAGRTEVNATTAFKVKGNLDGMLMLHGQNQKGMKDHNNDGFRDEPDIRQIHLFNRYDYLTPSADIRVGIRILGEERTGGQLSYSPGSSDTWTNGYGIAIKTERLEAFAKTGKVFNPGMGLSAGWINNFILHNQDSRFGTRVHTGEQRTWYSNLMFQVNPDLGKHTIDAGASFRMDHFNEMLGSLDLSKREYVPGLFAQYTYSDSASLTIIAGLRGDYHNLFGAFFTPRLHLRYAISPALTLRASAGKGYRTGNVIAENSYILASSREVIISGDIGREEAWNYGTSLTANIPVSEKTIKLSAEYFRTSFINQVIADIDADAQQARFYNLEGSSYSNIFQAEASFQPFEGLDLLAAWRLNDVKMTIDGELREKPLSSRYKGLFSASWHTRLRKWQLDYTLQLNGPGRIPSTAANPEEFRRDEQFPAFTVMNAQVTKYFKKLQIYAGVENLGGFRQHHPIISADDPFGDYFDSSLIWGPIKGRKFYGGFRFIINKK